MPPKRKAADESGPAKKKAATGPKLKKSKAPKWDEPEFSNEKPTGEWARKCVDRWCLLPPYNTSISEKRWEDYYKIEGCGIIELYQNTWEILRKASNDLAAILLGTNTRLYSPFGAGDSVDLFYEYHFRERTYSSTERFSSLHAKSRMHTEIDPKNPAACRALKAASDTVTVFNRVCVLIIVRNGSKSKGTTLANIKSFEKVLFCTEGWISPRKLTEILFAAANVMGYRERDDTTPKSVLEKFNYFDGETNGKNLLTEELKSLVALETRELADQKVVSIPHVYCSWLTTVERMRTKQARASKHLAIRAGALCLFIITLLFDGYSVFVIGRHV
ncbi:hypothetical protein B0J17DRAFT_624578 [Rhizoctonia solani]|nr:hypothetical protein B0J17DRAFT_624578 [Rhizoctonia solani]